MPQPPINPSTGHQMSRQGLAQKCQFLAKLGRFWAKNPNLYWRNQKFCYQQKIYLLYLSLTGLLTAIRGLNIYSHLYLRVLSPPGPCQALTINYNNQTIWILKLSLFSQFNSSQSPGRPQLTRHWIQVFLLKKDLPKPCTPPSPPGSSCREFSPPLRPPAGLQDG